MLCKCAGGGIMLCFRFRRRPLLHSSTHYFRRMNRSSVAGPRLCFGTAAQLARAGASPRPPCPQLAPAEEPQPTGPCPPAARGILATRRPTRANYRRHAGACAGGAQKLLLARQSGSIVVVSASWRVHRGRPRALPLGRGGGGGGHAARRASRASHAWRFVFVCLPAGCTTRSRASSWPTTGWSATP